MSAVLPWLGMLAGVACLGLGWRLERRQTAAAQDQTTDERAGRTRTGE